MLESKNSTWQEVAKNLESIFFLFSSSNSPADCFAADSLAQALPCSVGHTLYNENYGLCWPPSMMDFFLPNSRALLPTFHTFCPDGVSFCPDGVSFCPDSRPQPPFFTPPSHTPFGDMYVHNTPPPRPQNTPFHTHLHPTRTPPCG